MESNYDLEDPGWERAIIEQFILEDYDFRRSSNYTAVTAHTTGALNDSDLSFDSSLQQEINEF